MGQAGGSDRVGPALHCRPAQAQEGERSQRRPDVQEERKHEPQARTESSFSPICRKAAVSALSVSVQRTTGS